MVASCFPTYPQPKGQENEIENRYSAKNPKIKKQKKWKRKN